MQTSAQTAGCHRCHRPIFRQLVCGYEHFLRRCSRLELVLADRDEKPNAFFAEAIPVVASRAQHFSVLMPDHEKRGKLKAAPEHQFHCWKRSSGALQTVQVLSLETQMVCFVAENVGANKLQERGT